MRHVFTIAWHLLLFLVAVVVFYLGLGIGLAWNPAVGTILWVVAGAIALGNLFWMVRSINRMRRSAA